MGRTIDDYISALDTVISGLEQQSQRIVLSTKDSLLDLNKEQLYEYGIKSDGKPLRKYRPNTVAYKAEKGQIFTHTTLFDEGNFYRGFDTIFRNETVSIFSRDIKSSDLQDKYGSGIFGLTKSNEELYNYEIFKKELDDYLKKYL